MFVIFIAAIALFACTLVKSEQAVHFKCVWLSVAQLYLNRVAEK